MYRVGQMKLFLPWRHNCLIYGNFGFLSTETFLIKRPILYYIFCIPYEIFSPFYATYIRGFEFKDAEKGRYRDILKVFIVIVKNIPCTILNDKDFYTISNNSVLMHLRPNV